MSMFDNRLQKWINQWADAWQGDPHTFRSKIIVMTDNDETAFGTRDRNGSFKEFMRMSDQEWDDIVRQPALRSRASSNVAARFFLYHWLEEQAKLKPFIQFIKEYHNA